jgi:predicted transposase YdaD
MSVTTESAAYEIIKREGFAEGFEKGFEQGRKEKRMEIARNSISLGILMVEQIACAMKLSVEQVRELKESLKKDT